MKCQQMVCQLFAIDTKFVEEMFRGDFRSSDGIYDNEFASYSSETDSQDVETDQQVPGQCGRCRGEFCVNSECSM